MSKFKPGDRIVWDNDGIPIFGTVIKTPSDDPLPRPNKVWAIWDDDNHEAHIGEDVIKLISPEKTVDKLNAWTDFILDNANEFGGLNKEVRSFVFKAFEAGFNSKG